MTTVRIPVNATTPEGVERQVRRGLKHLGHDPDSRIVRESFTPLDGAHIGSRLSLFPMIAVAEVELMADES